MCERRLTASRRAAQQRVLRQKCEHDHTLAIWFGLTPVERLEFLQRLRKANPDLCSSSN
jgi:hypothetical protein